MEGAYGKMAPNMVHPHPRKIVNVTVDGKCDFTGVTMLRILGWEDCPGIMDNNEE